MSEIAPFKASEIFIVGTGIIPGLHLTREAEAVFKQSDIIFYVDESFGFGDFIKTYNKNTVDLYPICYNEGKSRMDSYRLMASKVLDAAAQNKVVSFALYGHPLVYAFPPFIVAAAAKLLGIKVRVLPGISSLDTLFVDLMIDPCTNGIQMYEATDLILRKRPLQPDVSCFIWQIGTVESRLFSRKSNEGRRFENIKSYLLNFYPKDHEMVAVYSASIPFSKPQKTYFTLDNITEFSRELHQGVTVYIPPVGTRDVQDSAILGIMDSANHHESLLVGNGTDF